MDHVQLKRQLVKQLGFDNWQFKLEDRRVVRLTRAPLCLSFTVDDWSHTLFRNLYGERRFDAVEQLIDPLYKKFNLDRVAYGTFECSYGIQNDEVFEPFDSNMAIENQSPRLRALIDKHLFPALQKFQTLELFHDHLQAEPYFPNVYAMLGNGHFQLCRIMAIKKLLGAEDFDKFSQGVIARTFPVDRREMDEVEIRRSCGAYYFDMKAAEDFYKTLKTSTS